MSYGNTIATIDMIVIVIDNMIVYSRYCACGVMRKYQCIYDCSWWFIVRQQQQQQQHWNEKMFAKHGYNATTATAAPPSPHFCGSFGFVFVYYAVRRVQDLIGNTITMMPITIIIIILATAASRQQHRVVIVFICSLLFGIIICRRNHCHHCHHCCRLIACSAMKILVWFLLHFCMVYGAPLEVHLKSK